MLAQMSRHFGERPSARFRIKDEVLALDFDLACSHVLTEFDAKRERVGRFNLLATLYNNIYAATGHAFAGKELPDIYSRVKIEDI